MTNDDPTGVPQSDLPPAMNETATPPILEQKKFTASFTGTSGEYFRIWIVNIALTIVTAGIYSAWAKVRTRRYFNTHTFIDGTNFDYHADPLKILKGRVIMAALFIGYSVGGKISPMIGGAFGILIFAALPWIIVRALRFNMHNTSYRSVRFGYDGKTGEAYIAYFKAILLTLFTLWLGYPAAQLIMKRFVVNFTRFGNARFRLDPELNLYPIYGRTILIILSISIPIAAMGFLFTKTPHDSADTKSMIFILVGIFYIASIFVGVYQAAAIYNAVMNSLRLGDLKIQSEISNRRVAFIYLTNVFACLFSLGLLYPWAKIRLSKAKLGALAFTGAANAFSQFQASASVAGTASADAASDFMDVDLGF